MALLSIGVDPGGKNSAIAVIQSDLKVLKVTKAPTYVTFNKSKKNTPKLNKETGRYENDYRKSHWTDFKLLGEIYKEFLTNDIIYTIERVSTRPGEGEKNSFIFGNSMGVHQGLYTMLNPIAYFDPTPAVWKKDLGVSSEKDSSLNLALIIFEGYLSPEDLKSVKKDHNLAEALLLAYIGLRSYIKES